MSVALRKVTQQNMRHDIDKQLKHSKAIADEQVQPKMALAERRYSLEAKARVYKARKSSIKTDYFNSIRHSPA
jgi:hypothetical protein